MSSPLQESPSIEFQTSEEAAAIKAIVDSFAKSNLLNDTDSAGKTDEKQPSRPRPMLIYTRDQLLYLSESPLVQLPPNMPELKHWFGDNELALSKKDSDLPTSNSSRDRRFRRELEDGDSSRPSFRSTLQPSQMGNFKHQSLRSGDRDRERDREREADRDLRDKEGLRHLSDKYDRDRMGMLPSTARAKDRDAAPHLNNNSSNRAASQTQPGVGNRRADARDAQKKRPVEVGDDWRRGDTARSTRDDRDDREGTRTKARDTSKTRRSPSRTRKEKDDRDRPSRGERDIDRDQEDDPRRWRDDGKRDERLASRRSDRDREVRTRERGGDHWEPSTNQRWSGNEERDGRYKRASGRDKKSGSNIDELKDDKREREKEKEPAWMGEYVPTSTSGILGGKSSTGELDSIQVWKKGLKEKELAIQEKSVDHNELDSPSSQDIGNKGLDEIQIFKLLMKRDEGRGIDATETSETEVKISVGEPLTTNSQPRPSPPTELFSAKEHSYSGLIPQSILAPSSSLHAPSPDALHTSERSGAETDAYNPPAGSRLLALGRASAKSPINQLSTMVANGAHIEAAAKSATNRNADAFSPFEGHLRQTEEIMQLPSSASFETGQRNDRPFGSSAPTNAYEISVDNNNAYAAAKGSRFAKFFDAKTKDGTVASIKSQTPPGFLSSSPNLPQRQEQGLFTTSGPHTPGERTMDDLFAMLSNSSQAQRSNLLNHPTPHHPLNNGPLLNHQSNTLGNHPSQTQHLQSNGRLDALYDSRLEDRNFVPDGMVPGLRTAPPRSRDNIGLYQDLPDEALQFHLQRIQQQQQVRGPEPFSGPSQPMYGPQSGRNNMGVPVHQAQFRGGPSPGIGPHNTLPNIQPQRLPPGLANLGGRPPHDPTHLLGLSGHPNALHGSLHSNMPPNQQSFNNFASTNNINYNNPQLRGPIPSIHHLQNPGPHPALGSLSLANNIDLRSQNLNHHLGVGGPMRAGNVIINSQQANNHLQGPLMGARPQQSHLPHHVPHLMPPHFQQPPVMNGPNSGHTNELIALLMGGAPRE